MRTTIRLILAVLLVFMGGVSAFAWDTGSLYCDGRIISVGDTAGEVLEKCGQPAYALQREQQMVSDYSYSGTTLVTTVVIDDWTFNFGPDRFQYRLLLKNGRVSRIEDLGYGY